MAGKQNKEEGKGWLSPWGGNSEKGTSFIFYKAKNGKTVVGDSVLPGDGLCTVADCA